MFLEHDTHAGQTLLQLPAKKKNGVWQQFINKITIHVLATWKDFHFWINFKRKMHTNLSLATLTCQIQELQIYKV